MAWFELDVAASPRGRENLDERREEHTVGTVERGIRKRVGETQLELRQRKPVVD